MRSSRRGAPKQVADLETHDVLDWSGPDGRRDWTLVGPEGLETVHVTPRLAVNDASVLRVAAIAGTGIGWIPAFLCDTDVRSGRLRRVRALDPGAALAEGLDDLVG